MQQPQRWELCNLDDGSFADRHRISDEDLAYSYSTYKPESPPSTCNWLLPGRLIIGSHPNVGIRSPEHKGVPSEALAPRMRKLLHLGVRTFLALQQEVGPQQDLVVHDGLWFSTQWPYRPAALEAAAALGITEEIQFLRFPIADMRTPDPTLLRPLLEDLERRLRAGEVVYMHCHAGVGRAGTVAACLLVSMFSEKSEQALRRVQLAFNTRTPYEPGNFICSSPETEAQKGFVRKFISEL
mmetsp:Transcript_18705/g.56585  ORF Transcript_18705/g.56585 Transcript_18705/m.56585 type:complete len:240 (-) Transcript_18705:437-1156(-)